MLLVNVKNNNNKTPLDFVLTEENMIGFFGVISINITVNVI